MYSGTGQKGSFCAPLDETLLDIPNCDPISSGLRVIVVILAYYMLVYPVDLTTQMDRQTESTLIYSRKDKF